MSGENLNDQDPDLSNEDNEDFVIEDLNRSEDLDELFPAPELPGQNAKPSKPASANADDVLFTDHTHGLQASEVFESKGDFAASGASDWDGEGLELDEVGVPPSAGAQSPDASEEFGVARDSFTEELGSMLQSEDEFGLDSEAELELLDNGNGSPQEFEVSGPFVLDDSEGEWQERTAASADDEVTELAAGPEGEDAQLEFEPALSEDVEEVEEGWEPLPESNVDELAEVDEVASTADAGYEPRAAVDPEDVEGHDIYAEDEEANTVLVGPRPATSRVAGVLAALAAMLMLFFAVGVVIARPEWFGLRVQPQGLEQVQIDRPSVQIATTTPPVPTATAALLAGVAEVPPKQENPETEVPSLPPVAVTPTLPPDGTQHATTTPPVVPNETTPTPTPTENPVAVTPTPHDGEPANGNPLATDPAAVVDPEGKPANGVQGWPVVIAQAPTPKVKDEHNGLMRISDDLMLGDNDPQPRSVRAIDGVMPGSRTFAQLHNGNYFIGNVKCLDEQTITLRMEHGEVTLRTVDIEKLTELGSRDYEELQKATSGFIRLTNNNRLVGGILSRIADDHIVLEFRSNRVMLPKSAIGEIVQGADDAGVRLDTTAEEDNWLRQIAERQLGTGQASPPPADKSAPLESKLVPVQKKPAEPEADAAPTPAPKPPAAKPVTPVKKVTKPVPKPAPAATAPTKEKKVHRPVSHQ